MSFPFRTIFIHAFVLVVTAVVASPSRAAGRIDANTVITIAELLARHKTGMKDKYVLRNPQIVNPATDAVYRAYFA